MKILQLCKKFPFPLKDGESIAVDTLAQSFYALGCEVTLLAMNTTKHFYGAKVYPEALSHYNEIHTVPVDNRIRIKDAFLNFFSQESYHISRFISPAFRDQLIRLLKKHEYEIVQLETLYLVPYIPYIRQYSNAVIALRAHNVEHEIWERISCSTRSLFKKWYLSYLTRKLKRFEIASLNECDILVPISQRDLSNFRSLGARIPSVVIPIGLSPEAYPPDYSSYQKEPSISFIGSLDWLPNQQGLSWFLERVWLPFQESCPNVKLHIAGRNMPKWLFRSRIKNIVVHGEVPDAVRFINAHSIMVVPLLSGSGMRAKILEGMALGKVVVTTTLGLEGIAARDREEVLIADDPASFLQLLEQSCRDHRRMEFLGRQARDFVTGQYESKKMARRLLDIYASMTVEAM